ncbi:hypothetical protein EDD86DRAFT_246979 [Gorgonomyces haynaldii]|nr:hypothetical protein EDD86DRAFT_246979 [Gorgonomyces haynaldii]
MEKYDVADFQLVDTDHGGTISRDELQTLMVTLAFVATVTKKVQTSVTAHELRFAFKVLDQYDDQHDGTIRMDTLINAFVKHATNKMSLEDAIELINQVAPQQDNGLFDYEQFIRIYFGKISADSK